MYTKIFRQIYEGTLCTKGPWQALVTFQQFLILADKFGVVDMTAEAIARITTVPLDVINIGISALEQEDSGSRNSNLNGRRIARLRDHTTWGWQIVNYEAFAKIRSAEERREYQKEYKREYRAKGRQSTSVRSGKHRSENVTMSTPHTHTQTHKTPLSGKPDDALLILAHLNKVAGTKFRPVAANVDLISNRLKQGATVDECKAVIDAKSAEWLHNPEMRQYLRPSTLFNATKFAQYQGAAKPVALGYDPSILAALRKQYGDRVRPSDNGYFYDPVLQVRFNPMGEKLLAV